MNEKTRRRSPRSQVDAEYAVSLKDICYSVGKGDDRVDILNGVEMLVPWSTSVAIIGSSGTGKTTLLSIMGGLLQPTSGDAMLVGESLVNADEETRCRLRGKYTGFIFQDYQLVPHLRAVENVMMPLELQGNPSSAARRIAAARLSAFELQNRLESYPSQLSGGEQQRVAIARAFISSPAVLFADEPTGNLDSVNSERVEQALFDQLKGVETALILVTHDEELAKKCDYVYRLGGGKLIRER